MKYKVAKTSQNSKKNKTLPLEKNTLIALNYLLGVLGGIFLLFITHNNATEKQPPDKDLLFHAWQSIITFGTLSIFLRWPFFYFTSPLTVFLALYLAYKSYIGEEVTIPIAGDIAEKIANK